VGGYGVPVEILFPVLVEVGAWWLLVQHVGSDGWLQSLALRGHSGTDGSGSGDEIGMGGGFRPTLIGPYALE